DDGEEADDNCYNRAAKCLSDWIDKGILIRDEKPAIYLYEQKLEYNHVTYSTRGFVARLALSEISQEKVMPCEVFVPKNTDIRSKFIEAVGANVSMINCMYIEYEREITDFMQEVSERRPLLDAVMPDGSRQRLWAIDDTAEIEFVQNILDNHTFFLLDGKNRYEISLEYARRKRAENPEHSGEEGYNYIMTLLTNACDDGFMQVPFHRLVRFPKGFKEEFFVSAAQDHFKIEKIIVDTQLGEMVDTIKKQIATARSINRFAVYTGKNYFYRLTLTDPDFLKRLLPDASDSYRGLDVTVLNKLILEDIFNIPEEAYIERITYTNSITQGIKELTKGTHQCMVCMNAVKTEQIRSVVTEGEKLPERSICVFPRPAVGVLINTLD
ncbi:MAG: DUF1015 domain-containing protein, partial [Clostridia bacterium]|nr:DUF1015 domain-containing protein [Clostridia bacterium]